MINKLSVIINTQREEYDCNVLNIKPNYYNYIYDKKDFNKYLQKAKYVKDSDKYEVWYREIFSSDELPNSICMIMDNVIYTMYVYRELCKRKLKEILFFCLIFITYLIVYFLRSDYTLINPFIIFLSLFDVITAIFDEYSVSKGMAESNEKL